MNNRVAREEYMQEIENTISQYYDDVFIKYYSDENTQFTFGQFADRSKKIEALIRGMDIRVGRHRIALISEIIPAAFTVLLASVYADASLIVIDPRLPVMMIHKMLLETECCAVFIGTDNDDLMNNIFTILMEHGNPKLAIRYAKRIIRDGEGKTPTEIAPGTKVYELAEELAKYLPEEVQIQFVDK